ncbi:tyrosine-type recombinase/integrase [Zwartia panacis]|uniref:tyrosine-type recombinase/integrase n=1 Tax=Zwartia panacis TaxID=2683345 RepID=UPI0025B31699|nr:site-specific integrase [Zwartia panacis]MDN4016191.1 integrase arm-type DNA-binding domain-containing protein [Zwartia panacis]
MPSTLTHTHLSRSLQAGRYFDTTPHLHLLVKANGAKYWVYRFVDHGKRRDLGLGRYPQTTIAEARTKANDFNLRLSRGEPLRIVEPSPPQAIIFRDFAQQYIEIHQAEWRNEKHTSQWLNTLEAYAYPVIGDLPLSQINTEHILTILQPIWLTKTETARRLRGRIERILAASTTRQLRSGVNPAAWRGHLDTLLPRPSRIQRVVHHAAAHYRHMHSIILAIREKVCVSAFALEFLILTAARTREVLGAKWSEIQGDVWVIPANRMKAYREHRVPLSQRCLEVLSMAKYHLGESEYIFHNDGRQLSNMAMSNLLKGIDRHCTVHGFRSTFRDWVAEETSFSGELAEMALAHTIRNQVEAAYRRGDLLQRRRVLMEDWSSFLSNVPAEVVVAFPLKRRSA